MIQKSASNAPKPAVPINLPPKKRIEAGIARYGHSEFITRALALIAGNSEGEDFLLYVGGDHAQGIIDGAPVLYWPELWGLRALLYVWDDSATSSVIGALNNTAWRVREMAARVVVAHEIPARIELMALLSDEKPRVRIAAARGLGAVGTLEDTERIAQLLKDAEIDVRRGAQQSLDALRKRFPRNA